MELSLAEAKKTTTSKIAPNYQRKSSKAELRPSVITTQYISRLRDIMQLPRAAREQETSLVGHVRKIILIRLLEEYNENMYSTS